MNKNRENLEYREYAGLDHYGLQDEMNGEPLKWLQKRR
jgi:hypothetical protein